jgi:hypothetical protein
MHVLERDCHRCLGLTSMHGPSLLCCTQGQGEPFYNYRNLSKAMQVLMDPEGCEVHLAQPQHPLRTS